MRTTIFVIGIYFVTGCDHRTAPPVFDPEPAAVVDAVDLEFDVTVEPQDNDPRRADVWVRTSRPSIWKLLPGDPASPEWNRLVAVRTRADADALPLSADETILPAGLKGEFAVLGGRLRFRMAEPLVAGETYRVEFYRSAIPGFDVPGAPATLPIVHWHIVPELRASDRPPGSQ
jgi:hypothetical protein